MSESLREKSNKRILVLANNDVGLYRFRKDLLAALLGAGHEVYISLPDGGFVSELVQLGCRFIDTPIERRGMNPIHDSKLFHQYRAILKEVKPDLVLTYTIKPNIYGGLACRMAHIPYAVNITGLGSAIENGGWLKKFVLALYKPALKGARVVFFENAGNRDTLAATGVVPQGRDVVLSGAGVNLEDYPYQSYPQEGAVRFLFVGRVMREKGVDELFAAAGIDAAKGRAAVESAISHGYFGADAYIDNRTATLVVRGAAPQPPKQPEPKPAPEPADQYAALLQQLRQANDAIPDPVMTAKISRLEAVSARIFELAKQDPGKKAQLQKFMDYYLPTALKLLNTYASLPAQDVQGENIADAKKNIERSMDLLVTAFENQLDKLFQSDALDVTTDIAALEGMLNMDGLTGNEFTK